MTWWKIFKRDLNHVNLQETAQAEEDVEYRKQRSAAVHAEVKHIVERNNLAEKFHAALTIKGKQS